MGFTSKIKTVITAAGMGLSVLAFNAQMAMAGSTDVSSGYSSVVGGGTSSSAVITKIGNFTSEGMKIAAALAAAFTLFHLVKAGLAMMSGSGTRKEEGMQQLKMTLIGGVIALGAYFFASIVGMIAGMLTGTST